MHVTGDTVQDEIWNGGQCIEVARTVEALLDYRLRPKVDPVDRRVFAFHGRIEDRQIFVLLGGGDDRAARRDCLDVEIRNTVVSSLRLDMRSLAARDPRDPGEILNGPLILQQLSGEVLER